MDVTRIKPISVSSLIPFKSWMYLNEAHCYLDDEHNRPQKWALLHAWVHEMKAHQQIIYGRISHLNETSWGEADIGCVLVSYLTFLLSSILPWTGSCFGNAIMQTVPKLLFVHWGAMSEDTRVHPPWKSSSSTIGQKNSTSAAGAFERDGGEAIQVEVHFFLCTELIQTYLREGVQKAMIFNT